MIAAIRSGWDRFWFSYSDQYHYGVLRVLLLGYLALIEVRAFHSGSWLRFAGEAPLELFRPCFAARWLSPPPQWVVANSAWLELLGLLLALMAAVGVFTRFSLIGYTYLFLIKQAFLNSFGVFHHHTPLVLVILVVLCACPGSTTPSASTLARELYGRIRGRPRPSRQLILTDAAPVWPVCLILLCMSVFYATSGVSKIRHSGWKWMDGKTLAFNLSEKRAGGYFTVRPGTEESEKWRDGFGLEAFVYDFGRNTALGHRLSERRLLTRISSVMTVLFEVGFPLVLFSRRICQVYFVGLFLFSWGTGATMGLNFLKMYWPVYALAIDWNAIGRKLAERLDA